MGVFYIPIILICPILGDCNDTTAYEKIELEETTTPISCMMAGEQKLATLAFHPQDGDGSTFVVKCVAKR